MSGCLFLIKKFSFCAGHRLFETVSKGHPCNNLHGHNYDVEVTVRKQDDGESMLIDFSELKKIIERVIGQCDHTLILNRKDPLAQAIPGVSIALMDGDPTVENLARLFASRIASQLPIEPPFEVSILIYETKNSVGGYTMQVEGKQDV